MAVTSKHTHEIFKNRSSNCQNAQKHRVKQRWRACGSRQLIAERRFISGERYTIADITAIVAFGLGEYAGLTIAPDMKNLLRWYTEESARPRAQA